MLTYPATVEKGEEVWAWWPPGTLTLAYALIVFGPRLSPLYRTLGAAVLVGIFCLYVSHERREVRHPDELNRRIRQEALVAAYPLSLLIVITAIVSQTLLGFSIDLTCRALLLLLALAYGISFKVARERYL